MVEPKTIMKQKPSIQTHDDAINLLARFRPRQALVIAIGAAMSFGEHAPSLTLEEALILTGAIVDSPITPQNPKMMAKHLSFAVRAYVRYQGDCSNGLEDCSFENRLANLRSVEAMALYVQAIFFAAARANLPVRNPRIIVDPSHFFKIQKTLSL
jgi:hypothetical protein